jgi:Divergent InlB B-repeat domain
MATPAAGSVFTGWSGSGCTGTGVCNVTLATAMTVTATFTAGTTSPTLSVSPNLARCGGTVAVTWNNIPAPTSRDWIALYLAASPDDPDYIEWIYVSCTQTPGAARASGSCTFRLPIDLELENYNFRLLPNDQLSPPLAISNTLTVR